MADTAERQAGNGRRPAKSPEAFRTISEVADQQSVPKKFLELILLDLKRHGLVHSYRGKKGGYALAKSPDKIYFGQVIRIIDGPLALAPCVSKTAFRKCEGCTDLETCPLREALMKARDATSDILEGYSLNEAARHGVLDEPVPAV